MKQVPYSVAIYFCFLGYIIQETENEVSMMVGFKLRTNIFPWQVPDYWKTYVHEVDKEREMWLNSFYKAPLRLPMPAELEHWWSKGICFLISTISAVLIDLETNGWLSKSYHTFPLFV